MCYDKNMQVQLHTISLKNVYSSSQAIFKFRTYQDLVKKVKSVKSIVKSHTHNLFFFLIFFLETGRIHRSYNPFAIGIFTKGLLDYSDLVSLFRVAIT